MSQILDYLIHEPSFADSAVRCYKLPFVACQALCVDSDHISELLFGKPMLMSKLFQFIVQVPKAKVLN